MNECRMYRYDIFAVQELVKLEDERILQNMR